MVGRSKRGMTLVEILVVIAIIGVLIMLVIPAVQSAREAAWRAECTGNLRQIGLALANYESAVGVLPPGVGDHRSYSLHAMLLHHLEQGPLFNAINFSVSSSNYGENSANYTAAQTQISIFVCPTESGVWPGRGATSYAGNAGTGFQRFGYNGIIVPSSYGPVRSGAISDGLSTTAAVAECLMGPGDADTRDAQRTVFETPVAFPRPDQYDEFVAVCRGLDTRSAVVSNNSRGVHWLEGFPGTTLYNHVLSPGERSCVNGRLIQLGAYTAGASR